MPSGGSGYQPDTKSPSSRRADFDLRRRISVLEASGGGGTGHGIPPGGTTGQALTKKTGTDYDVQWSTVSGGGGITDGNKGDITVSGGGTDWQLNTGVVGSPELLDNAVANNDLADMPANTLKGNNTAGTADPADLTAAQVKALLAITQTDVAGTVPTARTISTTVPLTGGGDLTTNRTLAINNFAGSAPGAVPTSPGGTTTYLRADGTWATPPTGGGVTDGDKGDITVSGGGTTWTIDPGVVDNTKLASMPANTFKANQGAIGQPEDLTQFQAKVLLGTATSTELGLVPAYGGSPAGAYLSNNLTWTVPPGSIPTTRTIATTLPLTGGGDLSANRTLAINTFTSTTSGIVPASGGGTTNFLRADGTWVVPPGGSGGTPNWPDGYPTYDPRYVNVDGDTMTGGLILPGGPWHDPGVATSLMLGTLATGGLAISSAGIVCRQPGSTTYNPLYLNEYGGLVIVGTGGLRNNCTNFLSLTGTNHPYQIGSTTGQNLRFDINKIQAVNNGAASGLFLNTYGGNIQFGNEGVTNDVIVPSTCRILLNGTATVTNAAMPKSYIDAGDTLNVKKTGDVMTGHLDVADYLTVGSTTNASWLNLWGGMTLMNPTGSSGTVIDGLDDLWVVRSHIAAAPATADAATRKDYVDAQVATRLDQATADARYVDVAGDTMTGTLTVQQAGANAAQLGFNNSDRIKCTRNAAATWNIITFFAADGTTREGYVGTSTSGMTVFADTGAVIFNPAFGDSGRFDANGNFMVGKTAAGIANVGCQWSVGTPQWGVTGDVTTPNIICNKVGSGIASGHSFQSFRNTNGEIGSITRNANTSAVLYNTSSDYRLKNDLGNIVDGLERANRLRPIRITWKEDPTEQEMDAFLAHEVAEVVPEAVTGEKDAVYTETNEDSGAVEGEIIPQQLDYSKLVPVLVAAVQELTAEVRDLRAELDLLTTGGTA